MNWKSFENRMDEGPESAFMWWVTRGFFAILICGFLGLILFGLGVVSNPFVQAGRIVNKRLKAQVNIHNTRAERFLFFLDRNGISANTGRRIDGTARA